MIDLNTFIVMQVFAMCAVVGYLIKYHIPQIPKDNIALIVSILGVILNVWINKWTISLEIILMGLVSGLSSTGAYELVKHTILSHKQPGEQDA